MNQAERYKELAARTERENPVPLLCGVGMERQRRRP